MAGEVFRTPPCSLLFTTCVGVQLLAVAVSMLLLFVLYPVYIERNYRLSMLIELYSLFALLGGFRSGSFYEQQRGRYWRMAMLISLLSWL